MPDIKNGYVDSSLTVREFVIACKQGAFPDRWSKPDRKDKIKTFVSFDTVHQVNVKYPKGTTDAQKVHNFRITVARVKPDGATEKPVVILLDSLSLDSKIRVRCGSIAQYRKGDNLEKKRICGDFYFLFMEALAKNKLLFGRNSTNGAPATTRNPTGSIGTCRHLAAAVRSMVETGFFGQVDRGKFLTEVKRYSKSV